MPPVELLYWYVPLALLFHLVLVYYLVRRAARTGTPGGHLPRATVGEGPTDDDAETKTPETVDCPRCGAENEYGYRFCCECVAELPRGPSISRTRSFPARRGIR